MEKDILSYFAWLLVVVVVTVFLFWLFCLKISAQPQPVAARGVQNQDRSQNQARAILAPATSVMPVGNGQDDQIVLNPAAHYRVAVPMGWYVEKNGASEVTVYPDYDPQASSSLVGGDAAARAIVTPTNQPSCKIEISLLPNQKNLVLDDWFTAYLHQDPTEDIVQISQTASQISGHDAIVWRGALNGVSTTLAYVIGDAVVYEFAPSAIGDSDCQDPFELILKNFTITLQ